MLLTVSEKNRETNTQSSIDVRSILPFLQGGGWRFWLSNGINKIMGAEASKQLFLNAEKREETNVFLSVIQEMKISLDYGDLLEKIPKKDPVVVVANHPLGGLDAIALSGLCAKKRDDTKVLGNALAASLHGAGKWIIPLDILGQRDATRRNVLALRTALENIRTGGLLAVFPAGAVSRWQSELGEISDPPWSTHIVKLALRAGVPILPVRFFGKNPAWFDLIGAIHPMVKTALLPRAFLASRGKTLYIRAGKMIYPSELKKNDLDEATEKVRNTVYRIPFSSP